MFTSYPSYPKYRSLYRRDPMMRGEDVYALQTALVAAGYPVGASGADGFLGDDTAAAIWHFQKQTGLDQDGKAGQRTQEELAIILGERSRVKYNLPVGLLYGQLMHESSMWLGNYSPLRPDSSYDAGVAQRNTAQTAPSLGFNAPASIEACAAHCRHYYDKYTLVKDERRRWSLAAGAWNAPAWTDRLAVGGVLSPASSAIIEAYMADVMVYVYF